VLTFDGRPAVSALAHTARHRVRRFEQWIVSHKIPVGRCDGGGDRHYQKHGTFLFDGISIVIRACPTRDRLARAVPAPVLILAIAALAWVLRRSLALAAFVALALLFISTGLLARHARDAVAGMVATLASTPSACRWA